MKDEGLAGPGRATVLTLDIHHPIKLFSFGYVQLTSLICWFFALILLFCCFVISLLLHFVHLHSAFSAQTPLHQSLRSIGLILIMADPNTISCPFCPFADSDADFVSQHIEFCHPEGGDALSDLESAAQDFPTDDSTDKYVDCPHGCGETVAAVELSIHLDLHVAEDMALDDVGGTPARSPPFPHDDEFDDDLDMLDSYKGGKRGIQRDSARVNTAKPPRPHSPPRTTNADGTQRLGVCFPYSLRKTSSLTSLSALN
jgi:hypothetical protein